MARVIKDVPPEPPKPIMAPMSSRLLTKRSNASLIAAIAVPRSPVNTALRPCGWYAAMSSGERCVRVGTELPNVERSAKVTGSPAASSRVHT